LDHPLIRSDRVRFFWIRRHGSITWLSTTSPSAPASTATSPRCSLGRRLYLLAHDSRTLELAEYHEIPHRTITSIEAGADAITLYAECDWNRLNKAHPDRWDKFETFLHDHNLTHVYDDGQNANAFDERLAATEFPPRYAP
jgi:hypothetical protein